MLSLRTKRRSIVVSTAKRNRLKTVFELIGLTADEIL
jgi:hypothetical protein